MESKELIEKLKSKDPSAQKQIFEEFNARLFTYFRLRIKGESAYEDLVQEVFTSFFEGVHRDKIDHDGYIAPYIFGIAKRVVYNFFYKKKKQSNIKQRVNEEFEVSYEFTENERIERENFIDSLKENIAKLKTIDQQILKEFFFKEKSIGEIAELTGKTKHYISVRKERLLKKLRNVAGEYLKEN